MTGSTNNTDKVRKVLTGTNQRATIAGIIAGIVSGGVFWALSSILGTGFAFIPRSPVEWAMVFLLILLAMGFATLKGGFLVVVFITIFSIIPIHWYYFTQGSGSIVVFGVPRELGLLLSAASVGILLGIVSYLLGVGVRITLFGSGESLDSVGFDRQN